MKKLACLLVVVTICGNALSAKKKNTVRRKKAPLTEEKSTMPPFPVATLCSNTDNLPEWKLALVRDITFPKNFQVPEYFRTMVTDEKGMNNYLKQVPFDTSNKRFIVPVYINKEIHCKEFIITRTRTMDDVLQAKYPDLMSFKAFEKGNSLNAARINCSGGSTSIQVYYDGLSYFVTPINFKGNTVYICYAKNDPNFQKNNFE